MKPSDAPADILVVDDEASIRYVLTETLTDAGYEVVAVDSGEAALEEIADRTFDLALVDLKLPGMSGIEVLSALRQRSEDTTVIVLTAHASLETAVAALRQGAHDYLFKPCEPEKLRESVRAGLRKRERQVRHREVLAQLERRIDEGVESLLVSAFERVIAPDADADADANAAGAVSRLTLDLRQHTIALDGTALSLSPTEFDLLAYLIREAPRVVPPEELMREVLGYVQEVGDASDLIRTHIYRIRQKLREVGGADVIRTVRGVGYRIAEAYTA